MLPAVRSAAAIHNQWSDTKQAVALKGHVEGAAQQVLTALPQSDAFEYATLANCVEQSFGRKHPCRSEEAGTQEPHTEARVRQEAYSSQNLRPYCVK